MRTEPIREESPYISRQESDANIFLGLKNEMQLLLAESSPDKEALIDWINTYSADFNELTKEEPQLFKRFIETKGDDTTRATFLAELHKKLEEAKRKRVH